MIFSIPSLLPWIAAAFLPWILHLFLFRKAETLRFPSLFFLKQCFGWSNRLKWQRVALLLTRSALILYFILSALGPRIERASSGAAVSGPVLFVLDDRPAMSMKVMARSESFYDLYRMAVLNDLERMPPGRQVSALALSDLAVQPSIRFDAPRAAMSKIRGEQVHSLALPAEQYLMTAADRLKCSIQFYSPFRLDLVHPRVQRAGPSPTPQPNLTLLSLKAPRTASAGSPVKIVAAVTDAYGRPADAMIRFRLDTQELAVVPAEDGQAAFVLTGAVEGRRLLQASILQPSPDGYPDDDELIAQIIFSGDRNVGVSAKSLPKSLSAAITAFDPDASPARLLSDADQWDQIRRVIVLDAASAPGAVLQRTVSRGADVVVFADAWESRSNVFPPALQMPMTADASIVSIAAGPLLKINRGADRYADDVPAGTLNRYLSLIRKIKMTPKPSDAVIASFSDGVPAVVRRQIDKGTITYIAFSVDDPFFQSDPMYLMFIQQIVSPPEPVAESAGAGRAGADALFASIPLRASAGVPLGASAPDGPVRLVRGSVSSILSLGYARGDFFAEISSPSPPPGLYRLLIGSEEKGSVNLYASPPPPVSMSAAASEKNSQMEMDAFFFWMAVLLMAVELLLLRQMRSPAHAS